ncbi:hypothetical protein HOD75_01115 [archaeon]|jgi:hypothetical protein|nr:hypothetical protein [archaeon]MBT4241478.1 hypothetical protein [archaeon]MBT4417651.1 hypothetical protein [archaeon]
MIYHRFQLNSKGNKKKITPTKAGALEKALVGQNYVFLGSSTGTNGARDSFLAGAPSDDHTVEWVKHIISELDLPYVYRDTYS